MSIVSQLWRAASSGFLYLLRGLICRARQRNRVAALRAPSDEDYSAVDGELRALARLEQVADDARDYAAHAKAPNTLKAYRIDWADFSEWCALHRLECTQN